MKLSIKKHSITLMLIVMIAFVWSSTVAFAASMDSTRSTTMYGITAGCDYSTDPEFSESGNFSTVGSAQIASTNINTISNYSCSTKATSSANTSYSILSGKSFFLFAGHGNAGLIKFWDGSSSSYIVGSRSSNTTTYRALSNLSGDTALADMRVMAFVGCYTANTSSSSGNLLTVATDDKGASSAIGFTNTVYFPSSGYTFIEKFTEKLADGKTVSSAASSAKSAVWLSNLQYYGYDSYTIEGDTSTKLY